METKFKKGDIIAHRLTDRKLIVLDGCVYNYWDGYVVKVRDYDGEVAYYIPEELRELK